MTRLRSRLPVVLTLSLLASSALAGPPVEQPAPAPAPAGASGGATVYDCQIAGRIERFVIAGGALAEGPGTLTVLAEGVYAVSRNGVNYLIDPTGVQIDQGVDAGKWPCAESAAAAPAPAPVPDANQMARIVALEGQVANLQAALTAANGDRDAAVLAREAAVAARDAAEASGAAAASAAQTALVEAAALQARAQQAEAAAAAATAAQGQAEVRVAEMETASMSALGAQAIAEARATELEAALTASTTRIAEMQILQDQTVETLAAAEARVAELEAALAAAMPAPEEDDTPVAEEMAEENDTPAEDMSEDHSAMEPQGFDADAALLAIDAAELSPISRAALSAAVEQARSNPALVAEVVIRLQNALGE